MLTKKARQTLILGILKKAGAKTQTELQGEMRRLGHAVSQVTVSRDLRELGVPKLAQGDGRRYALGAGAPPGGEAALKRILKEFVVSVEEAGQFLVVKTPPSGAQPVALALDRAGFPEVAGTVAGDDTIFVLSRRPALAAKVHARLKALLA